VEIIILRGITITGFLAILSFVYSIYCEITCYKNLNILELILFLSFAIFVTTMGGALVYLSFQIIIP